MLTLINRFSKYSIVILGFLAITLSHAQDERAEDISILDVDASGEVDALTDGLLLLRSMFGLTDDVLSHRCRRSLMLLLVMPTALTPI